MADKGYESREDILYCVMNGIVPNMVLKHDKEERVYPLELVGNEITEEDRNSMKPGDIRKCIHAGVLPACYEGIAIQVEVKDQSRISCFLSNGRSNCVGHYEPFNHRYSPALAQWSYPRRGSDKIPGRRASLKSIYPGHGQLGH